jgi:signal transduction histidine kinase
MGAPDTLPTSALDVQSSRRPRGWRRPRLPRYTIRLRLAVLYGSAFLIMGTLLLGLIVVSVGRASHSAVVSAQGAVARLVERNSVHAVPSAPLPPGAAGAAIARERAQAHHLEAVVLNVHPSDLHLLWFWSLVALAIMVVASMALGWLLAGRVLRPLQVITTAARELSASNLHERLALDGPNDELRELGDTFDELLARLESSFEAQRQFVANASHELRTPLTLERAILEVTLADPAANVASLRAACERVLAIGEQQERTIDALLALARGERGPQRREPLALDAIARHLLSERRAEVERRGLRLETELQHAPAVGDARLIERLVANLLDNAIQHNTADGWLKLTTALAGAETVLTVANSGPVIAADEVERLLRPFHRLGAERVSHGDGHGLGLSIVAAIVTAHGARLSVVPQPEGGLRVEVRFGQTRS